VRNYKGKEMSQFEQWFEQQDFYTNMRFIHGDALFTKDGDVYRVLPVQMTYTAHKHQQAEKAELESKLKAVNEIMNDYHTGSFEDAPELAGWGSTALLRGECE